MPFRHIDQFGIALSLLVLPLKNVKRMAGEIINMIKLKQVFLQRSKGISLESISKNVGCSRNTVKKYVRLAEKKGLALTTLVDLKTEELEQIFSEPTTMSKYRFADLEGLFPDYEIELQRVGVTRWTLWGEYKARYPDGYAYSLFCEYFRVWLKKHHATIHFEHLPGDKVFLDFTGKKLHLTDLQTGEITPVEVYVAVLGFSGLTYVEAVYNQKKEVFIATTENALYYFGGVPQALVPDNLKSAVTQADKYEPEINETFLDFANHYRTTVLPARSRKPKDKAMVENMVNIVYRRIFAPLRDRIFSSIKELNSAIWEQLENHNTLPLQKEAQSRREKFQEQEVSTLQPLPQSRYAFKRYKKAKVMKNCHIQIEKHYYSVPFRFIGKETMVVYTTQAVQIFCNHEQIAYHSRGIKAFSYTTVADHLPSSHRFVSEWSPEKFITWAENIDPEVKNYIEALLSQKAHPEQAYRSCIGILSLEKKLGRDRFIKVIRRGHFYKIYHYKAILKIIDGGLDMLFDPELEVQTDRLPYHKNIRGKESYQ